MKNKLLNLLKHPLGLLAAILLLLLGTLYLAWTVLGLPREHRALTLILTAVVGVCLVGSLALLLALKERKARADSALEQSLEDALTKLAERLPSDGALTRKGALRGLPWVVVLGSRGAGKSAAIDLLSGSSPDHRISAAGHELGHGGRTLFLAAPGLDAGPDWPRYLTAWRGLHAWIERRHGRPEAALLVLSAEELERGEEYLAQLGERFATLLQQLAGVPLFVLISQCDRLEGFLPLFSGMSLRERDQALGTPLGSRSQQALEDLCSTLDQRASLRLHLVGTAAEQSALLGFPMTLRTLGRQALALLGRFESNPPQMLFFAAAGQGGAVLRAAHLQLGTGAPIVPREAACPTSEQAWFFRGALSFVQRHACAGQRPRHGVRSLVLAGAVGVCVVSGVLLGHNYARTDRWLLRTEKAASALTSRGSRSAADGALAPTADLSAQAALLEAMCKAGEDGFRCGAPDSAQQVLSQARRLLRCRIGEELVRPLLRAQPGRLNPLYQQLLAGASWSKKQGSGQALLGGFRALKLVTLLHRGQSSSCPLPGWREARWSASYVADLWDRPELREPMQRSLEFFFSTYFEERQSTPALVPDEPQRIDAARRNLQSQGEGGDERGTSELDLWLAGSEMGLLEGKPVLSMSRALQAGRMPQLFTSAGCAALFDTKAQWDDWMGCVRGSTLPMRRPDQDRALQEHYIAAHRRAWNESLDSIALRDPSMLTDGKQLIDLLHALGPELERLFKAAGRGPNPPPATMPRWCREAERGLAALPFAAGQQVALDEDQPEIPAAYGAYQSGLKALGTALQAAIDGKPDPQAPLRPIEDALRALAEVQKQRQQLRQGLDRELLRQSPPVHLHALFRVLEEVERGAEGMLRRRLAQSLEEEWGKIYRAWLPLRYQPGETGNPLERCAQVRTLLEQVERFGQTYLDPLYEDLAQCRAKAAGLLGGKGLLCASACRQLATLRPLFVCPTAAAPAAPSLAQLPRLDIQPQPGCSPPELVILDTAERGYRYRCVNSSGRCEPAGSSSGRASVSAQSVPGQGLVLAEASSFAALIDQRDDGRVRESDRIATIFPIRDSGTCRGMTVRLFLDRSMKEGGSSAAWQNPRLLPEQLTCP